MKLKRIYFLLALILALALAGCGKDDEAAPKETDAKKSGDSYTVVDDRGVEITFDKVPETRCSSTSHYRLRILCDLQVA